MEYYSCGGRVTYRPAYKDRTGDTAVTTSAACAGLSITACTPAARAAAFPIAARSAVTARGNFKRSTA
jgi:hypothetical protein